MKEYKLIISILLAILPGYASAFQVCVQKIPNCRGTDLDCSRSVPCYHGNCTHEGSCSCLQCWTGQNCDQYVDNYLPKFLVAENTIRLSPYDSGILYTVNGLDEDGMNTCRQTTPCPCSEMRFSLVDGNKDDLFQMNQKEGDLYLQTGRELESGTEYNLMILVESVGGDIYREPDSTGRNTFRLNIIVSNSAYDENDQSAQAMQKHEDESENNFEYEENLDRPRSKRAAPTTTNDTSIAMNYTDTISSVLNVGDKIDLIITVLVPEGVTMDLTMEVFTSDPENQNAAYALCDISVMPLPSGVTSTLSSIAPQIVANLLLPLVNDHATISFGNVTGKSGSAAYDRTIVLSFSAVLVGNTPYVQDGGNYSIVAGTSYANETYIWVAAATFTANVPTDDSSTNFGSNQTIDGPSNVGANGFGLYVVDFYSTAPWGTVKVDVFGNLEASDSFSTGGIVISQMGANFNCTMGSSDPYSYTYVGQPSTSGLTTSHSSLAVNGVINCGDPGADRLNANSDDNMMLIKFLVFVPPNVNPIGSILSIGATITINDKTIWTNVLNITVGPEDDSKSASPTMSVRNTSISTSVQRVATILVDIKITENKYTDLVVQALAPNSGGPTALVSFCSVTATWGVNIPMVPTVQPNITSSTGGAPDTMTADFGRIWNSAMIAGNATAGTMTVSIDFRIEDAAANGKSITIQIVNSAGAVVAGPQNVALTVDTTPMNFTDTQGQVSIDMDDILNATSLVYEGETLVEMTVSLSNGSNFGSLTFEVMASLFNQSIEGRVCRAAVTFVGKKIPCINQQTLNNQVQYSSNNLLESDPVNSLAAMELGSVCLTGDVNTNSTDGQIVVTAAIELPKQLPGVTGSSYTLYGGIKLGQSTIWAGSSTYNIVPTQPDTFPPSCLPTVTASVSTATLPIPGMVTIALIQIKIPPTSQSVYTLTLTATAGNPFAICQLSIQYLGYNFPCVDPNPEPGNTSRVATTRLNYDSYDATLQANRKAILDFGSMSNLGQDPFTSDPTPDKNTIIVAAILKIDATATSSLNLGYTLKYTSGTAPSSPLVIPLSSAAPPPPPTTTNATISTLDGANTINVAITKVVAVDFLMPPGPGAATKVVFSNPNSGTNDFVFCSAAVTKVGKNIPCLNSTSATLTMDNTAGLNCSNSLQVNLGTTCFVQLVNDPKENWIRVEVAINILNMQLTTPITINAAVSIGSLTVTAGPLNLVVDNTNMPPLSTANLTATSLTNTSILAGIGNRRWVDFNLTVPNNSTMPLQVTATGASASGRAILTVTGIRVSAAGTNVACIKNTTIVNVLFNSSAAVTTKQNDVATVDFGYITNTGLTYRRGFNQPYDDQITISVEARMTDHPITDNNGQFSLSVLFESGDESVNTSQLLTVTRNQTEAPDIAVRAQVLNPKLFQRNEVVNVNILMFHTPTSSAEPTQTLIRLYLPSFVEFTGTPVGNVSTTTQPGTPFSLLLSDSFYFDEYISINFSLIIDPKGIRDPGSNMINATSIGRAFAKVTLRTIGGVQYPSTTDYLYAGTGFYWIYGMSAGNCHNPLGMQSGAIQDCQLSASATANSQFGPSQARLGNAAGKVWKPAIRNGIYQTYIQVKFGNRTRVSQVSFQKDDCCRAPLSIILQYSDQGIYWTDGYTDTALNYTGDTAVTNLATPFEGTMLRVIINGTDQPDSAATKYIGVKLEFFGCTLTTETLLTDVCNTTDTTIFSTDVNRYRHFSVDSKHNAVYTCDIQPNSLSLRCFCSEDGVTWKNIPSYITNIVGYDAATGFTYGRDCQNTTFFKSADCLSWLPSNSTEVAAAQSSSQFTNSIVVPGLPQNDPGMTLAAGSWEATFDGLYMGTSKRLGWS